MKIEGTKVPSWINNLSLPLYFASLPVLKSVKACILRRFTKHFSPAHFSIFSYTQKTFHYDSTYWSDKTGYGSSFAGQALDTNEVKLPTYWNTPFTKICLGMKTDDQLNFILIDLTADSLYSVIADGRHRSTFLGRNKWKTLIGSAASLQRNCNMEGFNNIASSAATYRSKARIGILGNEQNDCGTPDSRIGFGTGGYYDDSNTCGNEATTGSDNGDKHIKTMGYILVQ